MTRKARPEVDALDRRIIASLQEGFPLVPEPYAEVAAGFGMTEAELIARLKRLREDGVITRFGPFLDAAAMGGAFCLCAMAVPEADFERIAKAWNAWLAIRRDPAAPLDAHDVGIMMVFMKAARTQSGSLNPDDYVDMCGYAACAGEVAQD